MVQTGKSNQYRHADAGVGSESAAPIMGATLAVASAATALVLIIFTVPLTTLTATAQAVGADAGAQAWIMSAMSMGAASGLLVSGAIGDDYGRRRTFLVGTIILAIASTLGALSTSALFLIIARVAQGLGGAAILACSLGLVGQAYAKKELPYATGIWGAALGAGVAVGPILASELAAHGGWTAPYWLSATSALALAIVGRLLLTESRASKPRRIDLVGTVLLGLGMTSLLAGFTQSRGGWDQIGVYGLVFGGLALLAAFVIAERRMTNPMLDLSLFRRADFAGATLAALASGAGVLTLMSLIPIVLERVMAVSALTAALVLLAWSATTAFAAIGARWVRASPRTLLLGGLLGCAVGQLLVYGLDADSSILRLLPGMFLAGAANGILNAALGHQAITSVPADRSAMGSGANNTARYLGSATGLTICTVIVAHGGTASGATGLLTGWNSAVLVTVGFSLLGALAVFATGGRFGIGRVLVSRT